MYGGSALLPHPLLMEARKKPAKKKKTRGERRTRQEIWVGTMAQALNSPSYEATQETLYLKTNALKVK